MENNLPSTPGGCSSNKKKNQESTPLSRKPLTQLNNVQSYQRPGTWKKSKKHVNINQTTLDNDKRLPKSPQKPSGCCTLLCDSKSNLTEANELDSHCVSECKSKQSQSNNSEYISSSSPILISDNILTPVGNSLRKYNVQDASPCKTTPKACVPYNPFDQLPESLHLPTVSPSLFKEVVSPSEKEDTDFSWAIDHLAILRPAQFDSPVQDMDMPIDPEYEKRAQEAIDRFFSNVVVPSPWTGNSSLNLMSALFASNSASNVQLSSDSPVLNSPNMPYEQRNDLVKNLSKEETSQTNSKSCTVWCQTELSLPPILPKEIENVLAPYFTFTQEQNQNTEESDESSAFNNTTLRRKLLFSDDASSAPQSSDSHSTNTTEGRREKKSSDGLSSGSAEPLPLDEEETEYPWGVSMIRPPSRLSFAQSPSSSSFIQSSLGNNLSDSSSPGELKQRKSSVSPVHEISPISYIPPNGVRSFPSPSSEYQQTPSRRRFLSSPKLSPILSTPHRSQAPLISPPFTSSSAVQALMYDLDKNPRNCFDDDIDIKSDCNMEGSTIDSSKDSSFERTTANIGIIERYNTSESQGFVVSEERVDFGRSATPRNKESDVLASSSKTSPQFTSSPIRRTGSSSNSCQLDFSTFEDIAENSPQKLAESPSVSPIAWRYERRLTSERSDNDQDPSVSMSLHKQFPESDIDVTEGRKFSRVRGKSGSFACKQWHEMLVANSTRMDTESPVFFEGSGMDEASCGQDTGYQTGSLSLQTTNQSNFFQYGSSSLTKDPKSPHNLSPKCSSRFDHSTEFNDCDQGRTIEDMQIAGRLPPY